MSIIRNSITSSGGRRFLLSVGCGIVCTFLVWFGKITPEIFRDVVIACVASYIIGNTYQKIKSSHSDGSEGSEETDEEETDK